MYTLSEAEVIDSFQIFLNDLDRLSFAMNINEMIQMSVVDEEPDIILFQLLVSFYYLLKNKAGDMDILNYKFYLSLLQRTGFGINLNTCCICRKKVIISNTLNMELRGAVCKDCNPIGDSNKYISNEGFSALSYINRAPVESLYKLKLNDKVKEELYIIFNQFIYMSFGKIPKSLQLLKI